MGRRFFLAFVFILANGITFAQKLTRQQRFNLESLLDMAYHTRDPQKVFYLTDKIFQIDSANTDIIVMRALAYQARKDYARSMEQFNLYISRKPMSDAYIDRSYLKCLMGDTIEAVDDIEKAGAIWAYDESQCDRVSRFLGINSHLGLYFSKVLKRHPANVSARISLGIIYERVGNISLASGYYNSAVTAIKNIPLFGPEEYRWVYHLAAEASFMKKDYSGAIDAISESILLYPKDASYYRNRAKYYSLAGNSLQACNDMCRYQATVNDTMRFYCKNEDTLPSYRWKKRVEAERFYLEGRALKGNDSSKIYHAIECFSKALSVQPDHIYALGARASYYLILNQNSSAIADLDAVIKLNPESAQAFHYRAEAKRYTDRCKEAIADETEAIKLDSANSEFLSKRAAMETDIGDTVLAMNDLSKAIYYNEHFDKAYLHRGALKLFYSKDYYSALSDFQKAIEISENRVLQEHEATYYYYSALAYDKLQLYEKALEQMDNAISIKSKDAHYYFFSGEIKARMKNMKGACEDWTIAKKLGYKDLETVLLYNCTGEE